MIDKYKALSVLADFDRRKALPCLYMESSTECGYTETPDQAAQMLEKAVGTVSISLNPLKIDEGRILKPEQIARDLYGHWTPLREDFSPLQDEVPARLWIALPLCINAGVKDPDRAFMQVTEQIISDLISHGWGRPYILKNGEYMTILYKCRIARTEETELLYERVIEIISKTHTTDEVRVLRSGCLCMAQLDDDLTCPRQSIELTADHLRGFLQDLHIEKIKPDEWNAYRPEEFDVMSWFNAQGTKWIMSKAQELEIYKVSPDETIYFDRKYHKIGFYDRKDPAKKWNDYRMSAATMPADENWKRIEAKMYEDFNRNRPAPGRLRDLHMVASSDDVRTYTHNAKSLRNRDRSPKQYIKTGIALLDESPDGKHHGLPRKGVTILEARTSAGKTALLTQIKAHMMLDGGYRVWEYNAELDSDDVADLLEKNVAGIDQLQQPRKGIYEVTESDADKIWDALEGKYFLYDNRLGMKWQSIEESLIWHCEAHRIEVAILDDQIMVDAGILRAAQTNDGESEQVALMRRLHQLSQHYNLAIILVCHPRKDQSVKAVKRLVTPEDILGSTKLHALSTMCLVYHRIFNSPGIDGMDDFKERAKNTPDIFLKEDDPIFNSKADAVLQVAKDRFGGGSQSYLLPLYYEPGTARLKNSKTEHKIYSIFQRNELYSVDVNPFA